MKIILVIVLIWAFSYLSFGQNVLFLKNGDKINGKLEGYKNDSIIFKFQKTKLKFRTNDIVAIYFDEKTAPQNINNLKNSKETKQLDCKILGVVTYYFNKNFGYKSDVGAVVYVVDSSITHNIEFATIDTFHLGNIDRNISSVYKSMHEKVPDNIKTEISNYDFDDDDIFNALDLRASKNIDKIINSKDVIKTVVDGNGNYSIKIKPGIYYVYIISNFRRGATMTEILGKIYCERIVINEGEDINVSTKFEVD